MRRYLSIDQSTTRTGWAVFEDDGGSVTEWPLVSFGYISTPHNKHGLEAVLYQSDLITDLMIRVHAFALLYEGIYQGANVQTAIQLARLQGAILTHAHLNDVRTFEVTASDCTAYMRISNRTPRAAKKLAALRTAMLDTSAEVDEYIHALIVGDVSAELTDRWGASFCEDTADAIVIGRAGAMYLIDTWEEA